jgi:hypothetical protein
VLGGECVVRGQRLPALLELGDGLGVFGVEPRGEAMSGVHGVRAAGSFSHLMQQSFGAGLQPLGQGVEDVRCLMNQQRCSRAPANTLCSAAHAPSAPSPQLSLGSFLPRALRSRNTADQESADSR